jgi:serine protease Do
MPKLNPHRSLPAVALLFSLVAPSSARAEVPLSSSALSDVAEKVTPAVVNITTRRSRSMASVSPFEGHPMLREFFGPEFHKKPEVERGAGSGVVISKDGYIVTNHHVIDGADEIRVGFADKREFDARVIGTDKSSDIALVKIEAAGLPFMSFGDSGKLRLGEVVLAVGNPFGVGQTVTMGIVSAKGRGKLGIIDGGSGYEDFIQTDASINPGNSGGALVNLQGELVGINTAIISKTGAAAGVGFAVPSNMVKPILDQVREHGRVRRGWLGVAIQDLTPELAHLLRVGDAVRGVLVGTVVDNSPASKAKIQDEDVITAVNGTPTSNASELRNTVALMKPGSKVKLSILRAAKSIELTATLDEKASEDQAEPSEKEAEQKILSGLSVRDLEGDWRRRLGIPGKIAGVVVTDVEPGSPAERSGLNEGDVITSVDRKPIRSATEFLHAAKKDAKEILLRVYRAGVQTYVALKK